MFLSNDPSSGDINSSNLSYFIWPNSLLNPLSATNNVADDIFNFLLQILLEA